MEHSELDMKISSTKIRRLRSERGWSQEQLALASGLSLRTIQRVEAEGNASRETHVCLAATFEVVLAELTEESVADKPVAAQPLGSVAPLVLYKVTGALACLTLIPVLLSFGGVMPAAFNNYVSLSFMATIALSIYSGFGWYFTGAVKNPSHLKRAVQMLFIATAIFCGFASLSQSSRAELGFSAQIALVAVAIYIALDFFIAKRRALK